MSKFGSLRRSAWIRAGLIAIIMATSNLPVAMAQEPYPAIPDEPDALPVSAPASSGTVVSGEASWADEGVVAAMLAQPNVAFTIKINTLDDEWSVESDPAKRAATKCSLREALQATVQGNPNGNQGCGAASIGNFTEYNFDMIPGTYVLKLGTKPTDTVDELPNVGNGDKITIDGKGVVTIDGGGKLGRKTGIFRVVGGEMVLKKITLKNGVRGSGAAVQLSSGNLQLVEATFEENIADNGSGTAFGGAIDANGDVKCTKSIFKKNGAKGDGGAIHFGGSASVFDRCKFIENWAWGQGGAIENTGGGTSYPLIVESLFQGNFVKPPTGEPDFTQDPSGGGAIYNIGTIEIQRSEFVKNYTALSKGGGAIFNDGEMKIVDSALSRNEARIEGNVQTTMGGAILARGDLYLQRVSIHHNTAKLGGGLHGIGGLIYIVNTTISDNSAAFDGGVGNGLNPYNTGSEIHLIHSTIVRNDDNTPEPSNINSATNYKIYLGNSVIDSACGSIVNSYGGNVYYKFCARVPVDSNDDQTATDYQAMVTSDIGLEGLNNNGGPNLPEAEFLSIRVDSDSAAVDRGRDPQCADVLVEAKDQIAGQRPQGPKCDSGAMEVGSKPPKYESTPAAGQTIQFPAVFLGGGATQTQTKLTIKNSGGGVFQWQASVDEGWDGTFEFTGVKTSGGLSMNETAELTLFCKPKGQGSFYGMFLITTDLPDMPEIRYKLVCHSPNINGPYAGSNQQPGSASAGSAGPGETTQVSRSISNPGNQPVNGNATWKQTAGNAWSFSTNLAAVTAADASVAFAVPPGETLNFDIQCTPQAPGVISNVLRITTNDPINPVIEYEIGCEGVVPPAAPGLALMEAYDDGNPARRIVGMAISPDGRQLISGHWDDIGVGLYSVDQNSGGLSPQGSVSLPNMAAIGAVAFSPDGKNVYWTSSSGNGVAIANRDPNSGMVTPVKSITNATIYVCGVNPGNPPILITCPIQTMVGARDVEVSPDGANVYVSGQIDGSLTVFNRNLETGSLGYRQRFSNTVESTVPIEGAAGLAIPNDGKNVYMVSRTSSTLVNFARGDDGLLDLRQAFTNSVGGVTGINGVFAVAVSDDGEFVYAVGYSNDAVAIFDRNPADGFLTFVEAIGVGNGPYAIDISKDPNGERVLVSLWDGDGLTVLKRDRLTGQLKPVTILTEGVDAPNLDGVVNVVSSPDDAQVYLALWANSAGDSDASIRRVATLRPAPLVWNVSPASAAAGAQATTITVNGERFEDDSVVLWNGAALPTTFVNDRVLTALVDPAKLAAAGAFGIQVQTPQPGGGNSAALAFNVTAPGAQQTPSIESLSPPAAEFGEGPVNVIVTGANFIPQSQVRVNGGPVTTYYMSATRLLAELTAADLSTPGPLAFTVVNDPAAPAAAAQAAGVTVDPAQVDAVKTSLPLVFETSVPNTPAQASISSFAPASLPSGAPRQSITVKGSNFSQLAEAVSVALVDGTARPTLVIDDQTLLVTLRATDLAAPGALKVMIRTPGVPDSMSANFTVLAPGQNPKPVAETTFVEIAGSVRLTVSGSDFVSGAEVLLNGVVKPTTFVDSTRVIATISRADLATSKTVRVRNPGPGGGASNGLFLKEYYFTFAPIIGRK